MAFATPWKSTCDLLMSLLMGVNELPVLPMFPWGIDQQTQDITHFHPAALTGALLTLIVAEVTLVQRAPSTAKI